MRHPRRVPRLGAAAALARALGAAALALVVAGEGARAQGFGPPDDAEGRPAFACPLPLAPAGLPDGTTPSRLDVIVAMGPISAPIAACAPWTHGTVQWRLMFRGHDGAPVEVQLVSASAPTPTRAELRCMEVAACAARVPPFTRDTFTVSYPFRY